MVLGGVADATDRLTVETHGDSGGLGDRGGLAEGEETTCLMR